MKTISRQRRDELIDALRRGTVPMQSLDLLAVGLDRFAGTLGEELEAIKAGGAPRIFLKKLVADVLDRVDQFPDFHPRQHYALTIVETELTPVERQAMGASDVDEIELQL